jgi:hypothetical protein
VEVVILAKLLDNISRPQFHLLLLGSLASSWTWRHLATKVGKAGESNGNLPLKELAQDAVCQSRTSRLTGTALVSAEPA